MIEVLPDMPDGVSGIRVSGMVTGDEIRAFKSEMDGMLAATELRFVEVIAPDYAGFGRGGLVEDLKQGFGLLLEHHAAFKRIAIVSDEKWVAHTLHALSWLVPGELEIFGQDDLAKAKEWAAG